VARRVARGVLEGIGNTPLVRMDQLLPGFQSSVFAKMERFNPGGSIKDRAALGMLREKIERNELVPGKSVVVESTSGNLGIGLALVCQYFGLRLICIVDPRTTARNVEILGALQAEVELVTEPDPETGEFLPARLRRVRELAATVPNAYWPNQYQNPLNPKAQEETIREIDVALGGRIDYLFCTVGTCGTLRGCSDYLRRHGRSTTIVAVDAVGSRIFGGEARPRLIPGHGASVPATLAQPSTADELVQVSDLDCVVACRRTVQREAVLIGGSSGAATAALERFGDRIPPGSNCVLIFPDGGDRYLDTIYSDEWVTRNFGEISYLWKQTTEVGRAHAGHWTP
jgi:N-(2-amino-2-carboxyethyl)-L-glutamate synthase